MNVVTDRKRGPFPQPGQIKYDCNCPDWAGMCKAIAAVIYGIGARLDGRPSHGKWGFRRRRSPTGRRSRDRSARMPRVSKDCVGCTGRCRHQRIRRLARGG